MLPCSNSPSCFITGPPTHSVGARLVTVTGVCRRLSSSSSVTLHGGPAGGFSRASQAMTSCHLQSNYSSTVTLHGGPVVLRPVRVTPCFAHFVPIMSRAQCSITVVISSHQYQVKRSAEKNVFEMTYSVSSRTLSLNSVNQSTSVAIDFL